MASTSTRRTAPKSNLPLILALAAGGVGLLLAAVIVGAILLRTLAPAGTPNAPVVQAIGPRQDKEGVEWNKKELIEHLASRLGAIDSDTIPPHNSGVTGIAPAGRWESGPMVRIAKYGSPQRARDAAGESRAQHARWWGSFVFASDDEEYLNQVLAALE